MRKLKVDMTNVESYSKCEEGIHTAKIVAIDETTTQGGDDMLKITFEVVSGTSKGSKVFDNCVLTEKALWKLQTLLKALGMKCEGKLMIDLDKLIGKLVDIEVGHEEYNGQTRARINDYTKAGTKATAALEDDDEDDIEDEEEEEKPSKKPAPAKKGKKKPEPEPEEDEDEDEDWEEDEEDEEEKPKKKPAASKKSAPAKKSAPVKKSSKKVEEDDEDDWEDDDDDWEDEED